MGARQLGGAKAQKHGAQFESFIETVGHLSGFVVYKILTGCKYNSFKKKFIPQKNPFDFIFLDQRDPNQAIYFDAKSIEGERFPQSLIDTDQVKNLLAAHETGRIAGYIIYFDKLRKIYFFDAGQLFQLHFDDSLGPETGVFLGTIFEPNIRAIFTRANSNQGR
jgi:hypothetical protein